MKTVTITLTLTQDEADHIADRLDAKLSQGPPCEAMEIVSDEVIDALRSVTGVPYTSAAAHALNAPRAMVDGGVIHRWPMK